jgi:hypothetical protein
MSSVTPIEQKQETVPIEQNPSAAYYLELGKQTHVLLLAEFTEEFPNSAEMLEKANGADEKLAVIAQFANFWFGKTPLPMADGEPMAPTLQVCQQICKQFVDICMAQAAEHGITPTQVADYIVAHRVEVEQESSESDVAESVQPLIRALKQSIHRGQRMSRAQRLRKAKLEGAWKAGSREVHKCSLILTEGDSAKPSAVGSLSVV